MSNTKIGTLDFTNIGAASKFIAATLVSYNAVSANLHISACVGIFQAANYGRCENIGKLYHGLRKADQLAFRVWLGKHSSYELTIDGKTTKRNWLEFDSKAQTFEATFKVKPKSEESRKASVAATEETILAENPFFNKEVSRSDDPFTLTDLLANVKRFIATQRKRAEADELTIPANINEEFAKLMAIAETPVIQQKTSPVAA